MGVASGVENRVWEAVLVFVKAKLERMRRTVIEITRTEVSISSKNRGFRVQPALQSFPRASFGHLLRLGNCLDVVVRVWLHH